MTIPRRSWRAAGTLAAAAVVGLTGAVLTAGPAAAHTPTWDVTCTEVSLHLSAYNEGVTNQVTVTVDGKDLLPTETFGKGLDKKIALPEHDKALTVRLVVKAGDGEKYSRDESKQAPVCEETPQEPTPTPTPTETKPSETPTTATPTTATPTPTATPSETASSSAPAVATPSPSSPDLAETGSSSATPIIGGAAVAVLLAGGGIMWSVRKRRTAQH